MRKELRRLRVVAYSYWDQKAGESWGKELRRQIMKSNNNSSMLNIFVDLFIFAELNCSQNSLSISRRHSDCRCIISSQDSRTRRIHWIWAHYRINPWQKENNFLVHSKHRTVQSDAVLVKLILCSSLSKAVSRRLQRWLVERKDTVSWHSAALLHAP